MICNCLFILPLCIVAVSSAQFTPIQYAESVSSILKYNEGSLNSSPVIISNKRILNSNLNVSGGNIPYDRQGDGIHLTGCKNFVIENCIIGPTGGNGIALDDCESIEIRNCIFLDNSLSIIAENCSDIRIRNNQFINVQGRPDLIPQGDSGVRCYIQLKGINGGNCYVKDNVFESILGKSRPEDQINIALSAFPSSSPMIISGNKIRGGGPSTSGSGINASDDFPNYHQTPRSSPFTQNVIVQNNQLVNPGQAGIICPGGSNIKIVSNKIFGTHNSFTNVGIYVADYYNTLNCNSIEISSNQVNYIGNSSSWPGTPYPNPYWTDQIQCSNLNTLPWSTNDFSASINETLLPQRILTPFPIVMLKLDSSLSDFSGAHLDGTAYGGAAIVCDTYRKALQFNGTSSDYVTLPRSPWFKPSSQMITFSGWIKPANSQSVQGIIRSQDANGWTSGWRAALDAGSFYPTINTDKGRFSVACYGINSNTWTHVAFTYDGITLKGYVNGSLISSTPASGEIVYDTQSINLVLGGSEGTSNFSGRMADVKIFYGASNEGEIFSEYNSTKGMFDGTSVNTLPPFTGYYTTYDNYQTKAILPVNEVLQGSFGFATLNNAIWAQQISGTAYFIDFLGPDMYFSIPAGQTVRISATSLNGCSFPHETQYFDFIGTYNPLSAVYNSGSKEVIIKIDENIISRSESQLSKLLNQRGLSTNFISVQIYNTLGQLCKTGKLSGSQLALNISDLAQGIYIVRISTGGVQLLTTQILK